MTMPMTMHDGSEDPLAVALQQCGWQLAEPGRWHVQTDAGEATLEFAAHRDPWRSFFSAAAHCHPRRPSGC